MSVNDRTLREMRRQKARIDETVNATNRALVEAWVIAWDEISDEFAGAIAELIAIGAGEWPSRGQIYRAQRAQNAMKVAVDALDDLSTQARVTISKDVPLIVRQIDRFQEAIARTQLPEGKAGIRVTWDRVDERALNAIVKRTTQQITSLTRPLSRESEAAMKSVLTRGVAVGENPRAAAREMMRRTEHAFTGGRRRAETIATTEMLDASRHAALESRKANSETLRGWRWRAALDSRTCPSCLAMDGQEFPIDTFGPDDHQRGRCTSLPLTKTWRDLGIDLDEPAAVKVQTGREWFDEQPKATQERIMGKKRLQRIQSGELPWDLVSQRRETPGWRPSRVVAPLA